MKKKNRRGPATRNPFLPQFPSGFYVKSMLKKSIKLFSSINYKKDENGKVVKTTNYYEINDHVRLYRNRSLIEKLCYSPNKMETRDEDTKESTLRVFLYIMFTLKPNRDWIEMNPYILDQAINLKRTAYYTAIKQLTAREIIMKAEQKRDIFFINPNVFFCGKRAEYFRENAEEFIQYLNPK